jgi:hypothetical protein
MCFWPVTGCAGGDWGLKPCTDLGATERAADEETAGRHESRSGALLVRKSMPCKALTPADPPPCS